MLHRNLPRPTSEPRLPMRQVRVLIEDPSLFDEPFDPPRGHWCDVTLCSGPTNPYDICPFVASGDCPVGRVDVVIHALGGAWSEAVCAAWSESGTVVVDARALAPGTPERRFSHHLGSAITAMMPSDPDED